MSACKGGSQLANFQSPEWGKMPQSPQLRDNHIFSGGKGIVGQSSTRKREQLRRQCPQTVAEQVLGEQCTSHLRAYSLPNPTDDHLQWVQDSLRYGIKSILFGPPDTCRQFWATDIFWTATPQWSSTWHFPSLSSSKIKVSLKIPCMPTQTAMRAVEILMTVLGPSLQRVLFIYLAEISAHYIP